MKNIIQNIEVFTIPIVLGQQNIFFPKNFNLLEKKINRIHVLGDSFNSFENDNPVVPYDILNSIFFTFRNKEKKIILNNVPAASIAENSFLIHQIDDYIDFNFSQITITAQSMPGAIVIYSLLLAFEYETGDRVPVSEPKEFFRLFIPNDKSDINRSYRLADYQVSALVGKRITRIVCSSNPNALLNIRGLDGKMIKIPFLFLSFEKPFMVPEKIITFENLRIDFNNSFIETKNNYNDLDLTFYYE